jgi:hypothetical protein
VVLFRGVWHGEIETRPLKLGLQYGAESGAVTNSGGMLAAVSDVDDETLRCLHIKRVDKVKRINGTVKFEDAVQFQNT